MQLIGSEIAGKGGGGEEVCAGAGGQAVGVGSDAAAYRGALQIPARVENARGNHTARLQRQGSCSPAKRRNGEGAKLGVADDGSYLSNIKVALPLTKTLWPVWMQHQNEGSLLQSIYRLIKRQDTEDGSRQTRRWYFPMDVGGKMFLLLSSLLKTM